MQNAEMGTSNVRPRCQESRRLVKGGRRASVKITPEQPAERHSKPGRERPLQRRSLIRGHERPPAGGNESGTAEVCLRLCLSQRRDKGVF